MTLNEAEDALQRVVDLGHLSAGVGHHVINAFAAIVSNAELLRLDPPMPSLADPAVLADTIIRTSLEASNVARRLIDFTRPVTSIEPDRAAFTPHTLELSELVEDFVVAKRSQCDPKIAWKTDLKPLRPMKAHRKHLHSMLDYFVTNSLESLGREGGTIHFESSTDRRGWNVLEIVDDGQGMDATSLERAVEPFFTTKPGRLGVGLSIANGIWRRHRGTLSIHSNPGAGTKIRLCVEPSIV